MKRPVFVFEKSVGNFVIQRILNRPDWLARQNQNIVIAHKVGRHAKLHALVVIDIGIPGIAAVQDNHADILYIPADQIDKLFQVVPFIFG